MVVKDLSASLRKMLIAENAFTEESGKSIIIFPDSAESVLGETFMTTTSKIPGKLCQARTLPISNIKARIVTAGAF